MFIDIISNFKLSSKKHTKFVNVNFNYITFRILTIDNSDLGIVEDGAFTGLINVTQVLKCFLVVW